MFFFVLTCLALIKVESCLASFPLVWFDFQFGVLFSSTWLIHNSLKQNKFIVVGLGLLMHTSFLIIAGWSAASIGDARACPFQAQCCHVIVVTDSWAPDPVMAFLVW